MNMGNIVGSHEAVHWHKKWRSIKPSMYLTEIQRSLIIGSLLGDGTMRIGKGCVNANFKVEHGLMQKAYVFWKYRILQSFVYTEPKVSYRYASDGERYQKSWWFRTIRHPILTDIYYMFYPGEGYRNGKKHIPLQIFDLLDPLSLAIWIMDDGSYSKGRIDISTYPFLLEEIEMLAKVFGEKFGVTMRWYSDRDKGYRMCARKHETTKLVKLISPYVIPSLRYKVGFVTP